MYILQGGVRWYANCGFSLRRSVSFGQDTLLEIRPDNMYQPLTFLLPVTLKPSVIKTFRP